MINALCNLENILKHCLKQIGTERSHKYGCRSSNKQVVLSKVCRTKWRNNFEL